MVIGYAIISSALTAGLTALAAISAALSILAKAKTTKTTIKTV